MKLPSSIKSWFIRSTICLLPVFFTTACSSSNPTVLGSGVNQAYNTTGIIAVPPYTRTIFSSTNF